MKYLQPLIIVLLSLLFGVSYMSHRRSVESLNSKITSLETSLKDKSEEYEREIAYLKASQAQSEAGRAPLLRGENPPDGLIGLLSRQSAKTRDDALREMSVTLGLSAEQERKFAEILDGFREAKKAIAGKAELEKIPFFDSRYLDMINKARSDAMGKIRILLGDDLYEKMIEKGYDLRLGLRASDQAAPR